MIFLSTAGIVSISISCIVVLVGGFIALYFTVIKRFLLKRNVRELNRSFEYLHALLSGQDAQLIKRLELISRTNLLYVDIHMKYNKRYKEVKDRADAEAQNIINQLKDLVAAKNYSELKKTLPVSKTSLTDFENEVNALNNDLVNVIKPEEDCRTESLSLKEKLRQIKQDFYIKQTDLGLIETSYDKLFSNIEKCFSQFEVYIESAQYDEAKDVLDNISQVVNELNRISPKLPGICTTITSIIPEKISSMKERYEELISKSYPLSHLNVNGAVADMNEQLVKITNKLKEFDLQGVEEQLDGILSRIDNYLQLFDGEENSKEVFDNECDDIYKQDGQIEKRYIKLCNALPEIKKVYIISEVQQDNISVIRDQINKIGATKRSLDTFIHSGTLQPYSILVNKMHLLRDEAKDCMELLDDFDSYLLSLKTDSENGASKIESCHSELKKREIALKKSQINNFIEKYLPKIEETYSVIDSCFATISKTPIDVQKVSILVEDFSNKTEVLLKEIDANLEAKSKAEDAIVYGNRDRYYLENLHQILKQTEALYFEGEFSTSFEETDKVLHSIRSGNK